MPTSTGRKTGCRKVRPPVKMLIQVGAHRLGGQQQDHAIERPLDQGAACQPVGHLEHLRAHQRDEQIDQHQQRDDSEQDVLDHERLPINRSQPYAKTTTTAKHSTVSSIISTSTSIEDPPSLMDWSCALHTHDRRL